MMNRYTTLPFACVALIYLLNVYAETEISEDTMINEWFHRPETTYEKFLPLALEGDAEIQNFLGFMFYYGEGVLQDYKQAHIWFHKAAEQGNLKAQKNLVIFHSGAVAGIPQEYNEPEEATEWALRADENFHLLEGLAKNKVDINSDQESTIESQMMSGNQDIGEKIYLTFCAGCHGFNGDATYPSAPSFRLGERLLKDDAALMDSIINGKGDMPAWGETLDDNLLSYTLAYMRARFGGRDINLKLRTDNISETVDKEVLKSGENLYTTFCAGCHGFNGISQYVNSPSFALGERLHKSDHDLENSIANGKNAMPPWGNKLSNDQIKDILVFIRTLPALFQNGIASSLRGEPRLYFQFRPYGETQDIR